MTSDPEPDLVRPLRMVVPCPLRRRTPSASRPRPGIVGRLPHVANDDNRDGQKQASRERRSTQSAFGR